MPTQTEAAPFQFHKTTLGNGMRVVSCRMPHTRSVTISLFVGVGSRYESAEQAGMSHFIEHLMFKGTARRPTPVEISSTIEGTGGVINAGTEQEQTVYWCKVAENHFHEALDLMVDMLRNSLFRPEDVDKERMVIIEELNMINDNPAARLDAITDEMLWPDHPLGRDIGGTRNSINGITREMLSDFSGRYYSPSNIVVSVAGNVAPEDVVAAVESFTDGWPCVSPPGWTPFSEGQEEARLHLEYRRTEQAHLSIAVPGVSVRDPDQYVMDLLNVILGEGMSSRLFVEIRENRGLAYDVHSGVAHFLDCGAFIITAGVDPKRIYDAVATILEQVSLLRDGVPEEELERAKRLVSGRLLLRMEDTRTVSGWMGGHEILLGRVLDPDDVIGKVNAVTCEEIRRLANEILVTPKLNLAAVGPCRGHRRLERLLKL